MVSDPKTEEWKSLKDQFDALAHNEGVSETSIEQFLDDQIRYRFGAWIADVAERKAQNDIGA